MALRKSAQLLRKIGIYSQPTAGLNCPHDLTSHTIASAPARPARFCGEVRAGLPGTFYQRCMMISSLRVRDVGSARIRGDVSSLSGDVSGLRGDASGLMGDIDDCSLTADEREAGVDISSLIAREGA